MGGRGLCAIALLLAAGAPGGASRGAAARGGGSVCDAIAESVHNDDAAEMRRALAALESGADVNAICEGTYEPLTPLTMVVDAGGDRQAALLEILIDAGAAVDVRDGNDETALSLSRVFQNEQATAYLLSQLEAREAWDSEYEAWWADAHVGFLRWYVTSGNIEALTVSEFLEAFPEVPEASARRIMDKLLAVFRYEEKRKYLLEHPEEPDNPYYRDGEHTLFDSPETVEEVVRAVHGDGVKDAEL